MYNIEKTIKGNILTITVDLSSKGKVSKSGKSIVTASTEGNIAVGDSHHMMGINIYQVK